MTERVKGLSAHSTARLRRRAFEIVELGHEGDFFSKAFDFVLILLIIISVLTFAAETVPSLHAKYGMEFLLIEIFTVAVFTVEYVVRLWSSVEMPILSRLPSWKARMQMALRPGMLIDLAVILPFYLSFFMPLIDLRVLRLLRFLKLARYSPALYTLTRVIVNERRALLGALILVTTALLFASTGIYFLEKDLPGTQFTSVPASAWWAMATLTTVGYGDMFPVSPEGRMFGAVVMLIGLCLFALPIAIISTGFAQESSRHDFVVSWSLLSRIPLFAKLDARSIAELVNVLHSHSYPADTEVVRSGDQGSKMFFIAAGEVKMARPDVDVVLRTGDFFGEIAMIDREPHRDTVQSTCQVRLLELHYDDYIRLCRTQPEIGESISSVAAARRQSRG